jgi:hypothetical protein
MSEAGQTWPAAPVQGVDPNDLNSMDVSVLVAFTAGFVEASDFHGPARRMLGQLSFTDWPQIPDMRAAARVACAEAVELQEAASRFVLEAERYRRMLESNERSERLHRQTLRVERAQTRMNDIAALVEVRMRTARQG